MNDSDGILFRIKAIMEYYSLNQSSFAKHIGIDNGNLSKILNGKRSCDSGVLNKIILSFDNISRAWLLTGEGEMLTAVSLASTVQATERKGNIIPFYDAETTGGYNGRVSSSEGASEIVWYIQAGGWFAGRETAAIRHVGESMAEYPDGCILAVREVVDRHLLVPGKNYVIETSEYRVTKRLQHGCTKDTVSLYSTNQEKYEDGRLVYEPFEVRLSDIRRIFSVLGYIVNQSGEFNLIKV